MNKFLTDNYTLDVFYHTKSIFVHIPKTAGISISSSLYGNYAGGHKSLREYQEIFTGHEFKSFFKFSFVRNPWDRLFSAYNFLCDGGLNIFDETWTNNNIIKFTDFEDFVINWVSKENIFSYIHFYPQIYFMTPDQLDFLGRYESLAKDFEVVKSTLGIDSTLPKLNMSTSNSDYRDVYTSKMKHIVYKVYKEDIQSLNYDFNQISSP